MANLNIPRMSYPDGTAVTRSEPPSTIPRYVIRATSPIGLQPRQLQPLAPGPSSTVIRPLLLSKDDYWSDPQLVTRSPMGQVLISPSGSTRKKRAFMPDDRKDEKYWEKRRRNNAAARRSREKRKIVDVTMEQQIHALTMENNQLRAELNRLRKRFNASDKGPSSTITSSMDTTTSVKESRSNSVMHIHSSSNRSMSSSDTGFNDDVCSRGASSSIDEPSHLHTLAVAAQVVSDISVPAVNVPDVSVPDVSVPENMYKTLNNEHKKMLSDSGLESKTSSDSGVEQEQRSVLQSTEGTVSGDTCSISSRGSGSDFLSLPSEETSSKDTRSDTPGSQDDSSEKQRILTLKSLPHKLRYKVDSNWAYSESSSTSASPEMPEESPSNEATSPVRVGFMKQTAVCQKKHQQYLENRMRNNVANRKAKHIYKTEQNGGEEATENENAEMRRELEMMKKQLEELKKQFDEQKK